MAEYIRLFGDSFFASASTVKALKKYGTRFIAVEKIEVWKFPVQHLSSEEDTERVDHISLVSKTLHANKILTCFVNRQRTTINHKK